MYFTLLNLGNQVYFTLLNLGFNALASFIPPLSVSAAFSEVFLNDNQLSGTLPVQLVLNTVILNVANNNLVGPVPAAISRNRALIALMVGGNSLSGTFPASLAQASSLLICSLSDSLRGLGNNFTCPLPPGFVSNVPACAATICNCRAGSAFDATPAVGDCATCPAGTFSSESAVSCTPCALGSVSNAGSSSCSVCSSGAYANIETQTCDSCPLGMFSTSAGSTTCASCLSGQVTLNQTGSQSCTTCAAGSYAAANDFCVACQPGTYSAVAATTCSPCAPGSVAGANASTCTVCRKGTFANTATQSCDACAPGTSAPSAGSTSCTVNPPGFRSVQLTTMASVLTIGGLTASSVGQTQNATLVKSIAAALNATSASTVVITSVADSTPSGRHLLSGAVLVNFTITTDASAAPIQAALNASSSFANTLAASLQNTSDPVLSSVSARSLAVAEPSVEVEVLPSQPCEAGTFLDSRTQECTICGAGFYSPEAGAASCLPCPASTYALNSTYCSACPLGSSSAAGTAVVADCLCTYGFLQLPTADGEPGFTCTQCPEGGKCIGDDTPLALDGFWHVADSRLEFWDCEEGFCLEEEEVTNVTNCREGHTGLVCGECLEGWTIQGEFCGLCPPDSAFTQWPRAKLAGIVFISGFLFLASSLLYLLGPIFKPADLVKDMAVKAGVNVSTDGAQSAQLAKAQATATAITKILFFIQVPVRGLIENVQIISSFKKTMRLAWYVVLRAARSCARADSPSAGAHHEPNAAECYVCAGQHFFRLSSKS